MLFKSSVIIILLKCISAAFVEVGSNYSVLDQPELCFVYEFVGTKDGDRESTQVKTNYHSCIEMYKLTISLHRNV